MYTAVGSATGTAGAPGDEGFQAVERIRRSFSETSVLQAAFQMDQMRLARMAALPGPERATQLTDAGWV